jgi:sugar lactone lactonase YvrE
MKQSYNCVTFLLPLVCLLSCLLTGCALQGAAGSASTAPSTATKSVAGTSGSIYGGQQPIYNGRVYVMAANTSTYGGASTSLMKQDASTVADTTVLGTPTNPAYYTLTDPSGYFYLTTSNYSCTPGQQVYVLSLQGEDNYVPANIITTGTNNPMIGLMAVMGQCPSDGTFVGHLNFVFVNEVSTIVTAYALAGFATNGSHIGSSSTNTAVGLANAFANANQLYDVEGSSVYHEARATTPGTGTTGTVPQNLIDTLANILAACVNDTLNTTYPPNGSSCTTLYNNTGNASNTADAAIYIAQHPGNAVTALYGLQSGNVQFADDLATQPNDFTLGIKFAGTGLSSPVDIAVDASGDAWVTSSANYLSELTPLGVHATNSPATLAGASYIALDTSGNPWVTSTTATVVSQLTGLLATGNLYNNANLSNSDGIASDGNGHVVVASPGGGQTLFGLLGATGSLTEITGTGNAATYTTYTDSFLSTTLLNYLPLVSQVAIDSSGYAWVSGDQLDCTGLVLCYGENVERISLTNFTPPSLLFPFGNGGLDFRQQVGTVNCLIPFLNVFCEAANQIGGIAIDSSGNAWVPVTGTPSSLARISTTPTQTNFTGGGLNSPLGIAIDGTGNIWVANSGNNSVSKFTSAGAAVSGTNGYSAASTMSAPTNLDIDPSGNVWVVNSTGGGVTELIGAATPVVRPLSTAVSTHKLGQQP